MEQETASTAVDLLKSKVEKLRANETNVGIEKLNTTYAAAYGKLKAEISSLASDIINKTLEHVLVPKSANEKEICEFVAKYKNKFKSSIYGRYDVDAMLDTLEDMEMELMMKYHAFISFDENEFDN